jgi:L-ribulokinase
MFAATAAGAYATVADAQDAMNSGFAKEYFPEPDQVKIYDEVYQRYLKLGAYCEEVAK